MIEAFCKQTTFSSPPLSFDPCSDSQSSDKEVLRGYFPSSGVRNNKKISFSKSDIYMETISELAKLFGTANKIGVFSMRQAK